ncbi:MAG TPA: YbhB/YbcL family Raf kinase inhibitor-like protein [Acidimicrobiales bacterium]
MAKDRDQLTPEDADDLRHLQSSRGEGTGGSWEDVLPGEAEGRREQMELTSDTFEDGEMLPERCAHDRDNISPSLSWGLTPEETEELAILCQDPDAPTGTFTHWVLTGIDPSISEMDEDSIPPGAVPGVNDFGEVGWSGPQPPAGDPAHRYVFTLLASAVSLDLGSDATADELLEAIDEDLLARGELVGLYQQP